MFKNLLLYVWIALAAMLAVSIYLPNRATLTVDKRVTIPHLPSGPSATDQQQKPDSKQAKAEAVPITGQAKQPQAYDPGCPYPKDREDADLCEQRRMAKAAEESVAIADSQWWLAFYSLVLLAVATVAAIAAAIFAKGAAEAGRSGVVEANRAVRVARQTLVAQQRPWISVEIKNITIRHEDERTFIGYGVNYVNFGNSPAFVVFQQEVASRRADFRPDERFAGLDERQVNRIVQQGKSVADLKVHLVEEGQRNLDPRRRIILFVAVRYRMAEGEEQFQNLSVFHIFIDDNDIADNVPGAYEAGFRVVPVVSQSRMT